MNELTQALDQVAIATADAISTEIARTEHRLAILRLLDQVVSARDARFRYVHKVDEAVVPEETPPATETVEQPAASNADAEKPRWKSPSILRQSKPRQTRTKTPLGVERLNAAQQKLVQHLLANPSIGYKAIMSLTGLPPVHFGDLISNTPGIVKCPRTKTYSYQPDRSE